MAQISLVSAFRAVAREQRSATAIVDDEAELSYDELDERSTLMAGHLIAHGVAPGDFVGLVVDRTACTPIEILAILKAGAAYVPLDPGYPADRLKYMAAAAGLRLAVSGPGVGHIPLPPEVAVLDLTSIADGRRADVVLPEPGPDSPAYAIFTSGSTGLPKGCVVTHGNVMALLRAALACFDVGASDRWSVFHSHCFDVSVFELWSALATGATAVLVPGSAATSPEHMVELLIEQRVTVLSQVPSVFRYLAMAYEEREDDLPNLRYVLFAGESVDLQDVAKFLSGFPERQPTMVNMYGITEITVHGTFKELIQADLEGGVRSPIGLPFQHLDIEIRDADRRPVPDGVAGEMWVAGEGVAAGYLNQPELTAERFVVLDSPSGPRRYYRSGDLARVLDTGELEYLGRNDQQIKLRGFRVEAEEIEAVLRGHPQVSDAAVTLVTSKSGVQRLLAFVVPHADVSIQEVKEHAAAFLPQHSLPNRFLTVAQLPRTSSGKLDRATLAVLADS